MKILILPLPEMSHMNSFHHLIKRLGRFEHDCTIYVRKEHEFVVKDCKHTVRYYSRYFLDNIFNLNETLKKNHVGIDSDKDILTKDNIQSSCNAYMGAYVFRLRCMKKYLKMEEDFSSYDLIIYDYYLDFGAFLAKMYKIPSVTLISTLLPIKDNNDQYLENFINMKYFSNIYDSSFKKDELRNRLITSLDIMSKEIMYITKQPFDFFRNGISKLNIYSTSKELYPFKFDKCEVEFVGREFIDKECLHRKRNRRRKILFYYGALETQEQIRLFKCILKNLTLLSYEIHVAIKDKVEEIYIEEDIKEQIILEHNIRLEDRFSEMDLYVCHGGLGGIQEAIVYGVPIVGIGTSGERYENCKRIEQLGMGKSIEPSCKYIDLLFKDKVEEIFNCDIYQKNCERYRESLNIGDDNLNCIIERILHVGEIDVERKMI